MYLFLVLNLSLLPDTKAIDSASIIYVSINYLDFNFKTDYAVTASGSDGKEWGWVIDNSHTCILPIKDPKIWMDTSLSCVTIQVFKKEEISSTGGSIDTPGSEILTDNNTQKVILLGKVSIPFDLLVEDQKITKWYNIDSQQNRIKNYHASESGFVDEDLPVNSSPGAIKISVTCKRYFFKFVFILFVSNIMMFLR